MNQQNFDAIKIAFFDIDGTLVDMNKKVITPRMLDTCLLYTSSERRADAGRL